MIGLHLVYKLNPMQNKTLIVAFVMDTTKLLMTTYAGAIDVSPTPTWAVARWLEDHLASGSIFCFHDRNCICKDGLLEELETLMM